MTARHAATVGVVLMGGGLASSAWPHPGWPAIVVLAAGLPLILAVSARSTLAPIVVWSAMTIPLAVLLWRISERVPGSIGPLLGALAILGAVAFGLFGGSPSRRWLVALTAFVGLVAFFSGGQGSSGAMLRWLAAHGLPDETARTVTLAFRKTVHFAFYGSLAWVVFRAMRASDLNRRKAVRTALLAAFAVASFDELRQAGYRDRTGSAWDVLLDLAGATAFLGLSVLRDRAKR